jgi:antitoxin component YwqK of YwqJK toxin-antitoxin module
MKNIFLFLLLITVSANAQYKNFVLLDNGDTLNRLDNNNLKQGRWKVHVNALRVDPAYDEEGSFIDNKKDGIWRKYDMYGLLFAQENYKWGNKNGLQQYLNQGRLERDENWRAIDPKNQFDTVEVNDLANEFKIDKKVVKVESYSVPLGRWTYYNPETGIVIKTEEYNVLGQLVVPVVKVTTAVTDSIPKPKIKPKEILQYEKKNSKKSFKVRDGGTGY